MRTVNVTKVGVSLLGPYLDSWTKVRRAPNKVKLLIWLVWATLTAGPVLGRTNASADIAEDPVIQTWQTKDGLPQNTIYAILQTRDGYLWVGTGGGLARFDGSRFRTFGLQSGLRSVSISALVEDAQGVLWVGTRGGGVSRWENGKFTTFSTENGLPSTQVESLAADTKGTLWVGTDHGLIEYHHAEFRRVGLAEGLPEKHIRALLVDSKGALWVSVITVGLFKRVDQKFEPVEPQNEGLKSGYSLFEDREGSIWAGGGNGHVWQWREGICTEYTKTNGLPGSSFESLAQGPYGPLWFGARDQSLLYFSEGTFHKVALGAGLAGALYSDREGHLWTGTAGGGLSRLSPRLLRNLGRKEGLQSRSVQSVAQDTSGRLYVGTLGGGIWVFENGKFSRVNDPEVSGLYAHPYTTLATQDGSVWVAGEGFLYRFRHGQQTQGYFDSLHGEAVRALCEDNDSLWLGTYYSTLLKFAGTNLQVVATNGTFGGAITSIVREAPDTLWIGTLNGLYQWDHGHIHRWTTADGLLCSAVQALYRDADGTLWIGTMGGGLARMKNGRFLNVTSQAGLADDVVSQIIPDDFGHLWLGCNVGIMRLERRDIDELASGRSSFVHVALFGQNEGMLKEQCSSAHSPTALKTKAGTLLFPTIDGLVEVDPRQALESPGPMPEATIEEVKVDSQAQQLTAPLMIGPGSQRLEINYDAPRLRGGAPVHFRFRLEPLDKSWVDAGVRRTAFYSRLRPGHYVFRVTASDTHGEWNPNGAALVMTLHPFYWQTLWFQSVAGLIVCGAALGWLRHRMGGLKKRHAAQENFTRQLLLSQENERKRVASELHDGLGQDLLLIKNRLSLLSANSNHSPEVARQLAEVSTNATRAIADVRAISHALRPAALEQVGFTKAVEWMLEKVAETSRMRFGSDIDDIDGLLGPEKEINLYRIIQEGLNNVLKHSQASQVLVEIKRQQSNISVSIFDDGKGFDPAQLNGKAGKHPSFGLTGIKERAKVLDGILTLQSAPGTGTRLTVNVPLSKNGE